MKFINKLNTIDCAENLATTDNILCQTLAQLDCGKFSYNFYPTDFSQHRTALHVLCTEPAQGWQEHYTLHQYNEIDPILNRMRKSYLPISWTLENDLLTSGQQQKKLFADALDFGLRGGFAIPVHAPMGEFANLVIQDVAILKQIKRYPEIVPHLQLIAYHYHARVNHFLKNENAKKIAVKLTSREKDCLRLTAQHKTAKDIALILAITPRTVSFHLENVLKKLCVANKYQAVSKALQYDLLS